MDSVRQKIVSDGFMSVHDVAEYWSVSPRTVRRLIDNGDIPHTKIRGQRRIPKRWVYQISAERLKGGGFRAMH